MKKLIELEQEFTLQDYGCEIAREDFLNNFAKTTERETYSFVDKIKTSPVYKCTIQGYEHFRFVIIGKQLCRLSDGPEPKYAPNHEEVPMASWFLNIERKKPERKLRQATPEEIREMEIKEKKEREEARTRRILSHIKFR